MAHCALVEPQRCLPFSTALSHAPLWNGTAVIQGRTMMFACCYAAPSGGVARFYLQHLILHAAQHYVAPRGSSRTLRTARRIRCTPFFAPAHLIFCCSVLPDDARSYSFLLTFALQLFRRRRADYAALNFFMPCGGAVLFKIL